MKTLAQAAYSVCCKSLSPSLRTQEAHWAPTPHRPAASASQPSHLGQKLITGHMRPPWALLSRSAHVGSSGILLGALKMQYTTFAGHLDGASHHVEVAAHTAVMTVASAGCQECTSHHIPLVSQTHSLKHFIDRLLRF
jgi:hypothetical protein